MQIIKQDFDQLFTNNRLAISLVGMSGIGKTSQSLRLKKIGFEHKCVDDLIAGRLVTGKADVANWLSQPYSPGYKKREKEYLKQERMATQGALRDLRQNTIIDTTGSVIYLPARTKRLLKELTLVVYLQENYVLKHQLFKKYMDKPKPVIWGNKFRRQAGEDGLSALAHCYPALLKFRAEKYKKLADIILPYQTLNNGKRLNSQAFFNIIRNQLN